MPCAKVEEGFNTKVKHDTNECGHLHMCKGSVEHCFNKGSTLAIYNNVGSLFSTLQNNVKRHF